jgi:hypothetical protein
MTRAAGTSERPGGVLAYAAVVAGRAVSNQSSGPHNALGKGSDNSEHADSFEEATRRMSHGDISGSLWHV